MRDRDDHHSTSRLQGRQQKSKGRKTWRKEKLNRNGKLRRFRTKDSAGTENFSNPRSQRLNEDGVQQNTASFKSLDSLDSFAWFVDGGFLKVLVTCRCHCVVTRWRRNEKQRKNKELRSKERLKRSGTESFWNVCGSCLTLIEKYWLLTTRPFLWMYWATWYLSKLEWQQSAKYVVSCTRAKGTHDDFP